MKPKATIAHEQHRLKRPAALADAEIAHLETVVRYFVNTRADDASEYFGLGYWLARSLASQTSVSSFISFLLSSDVSPRCGQCLWVQHRKNRPRVRISAAHAAIDIR